MQSIVLATDNPGKVTELNALLGNLGFTIVPQSARQVAAVEETGLSFVENALLKARNAARCTGMPAIADDSGLEVDALAGAPGIHSARYAGPNASDRDNVNKLLRALDATPDSQRNARFVCSLVYLRHHRDPTPILCQGTWKGSITRTPQGNGGFGYDPVFLVLSEGKTAAQLPPEVKNRLSHRAQALAQLLTCLAESPRLGI